MTGQDLSSQGLLQRRLALVAELSLLTAHAHKLIQELSATEMDMLRLELEIERNPARDELVRELQEIQDHAAALCSSQADCLDRTALVEAEMEEIDGLIATARGGYR